MRAVKDRRFTVPNFASFILPGNSTVGEARKISHMAYALASNLGPDVFNVRVTWTSNDLSVIDSMRLYDFEWYRNSGKIRVRIFMR